MYRIPQNVYEFFAKNPQLCAADCARYLHLPGRTVRRYRYFWQKGEAVPVQPDHKITSARMEELADGFEDEFDVDSFLEAAPQQVQRCQKADPMLVNDTFTFTGDEPVAVAFVSCMHLGGRYTAYREFREIYDAILNIPRLYFGSLGDDIEGFAAYFKNVKASQDQLLNIRQQRVLLERILEPLSTQNKLLFGCGSQHNDKWTKAHSGENPIKELYMNAFNVPYFDGTAYIRFIVGQQTYYIALAHEFPGTSQWNPVQAQARAHKFRFPMADVVVQGDKHTLAYSKETSFMDEYLMGNRPTPYVWLLQSGTAKTGPDEYTIMNWPLGNFGWPIAVFYPDKHDIAVDMDLDRVRRLLSA